MKYHILAFFAGFLLDLLLGDPYWLPHPIRAIGNLISWWEKTLIGPKDSKYGKLTSKEKRTRGKILVLAVCLTSTLVALLILVLAYKIHPFLGLVVEAIMTYQLLATKCLKVESMKVYEKLTHGTIEEARYAVSMIVGRDTQNLTSEGVAKAAVETVAENTSDGIIAPMLYTAIGGPVLGFLYKSINTMDSMVGYKNDRYLDFGRCAAKLDDVVNFLPSRISAYLMIVACFFLGKEFDGKEARRIYVRDRRKHASPNSAQTESACAGALGLQLAGPASYFGVLHDKPFIGDAKRTIEPEDIKRANKLLYGTAFLCEILCLLVLGFFLLL